MTLNYHERLLIWEKRGRGKADVMCSVCFTQHVDDPFIVSSKQPYGVFEEKHERRVDHAVGQLVGVGLHEGGKNFLTSGRDISAAATDFRCVFYLEIQQRIQLVLNNGQSLNQLLRVHGAHHTVSPINTQMQHAQDLTTL